MNKTQNAIIIGVGLLIAAVAAWFLIDDHGTIQGRHRVVTELAVIHGDREIRNSVEAECVRQVGGDWSTGRQVGVYQVGDDPFIVLPDRSILFMSMHMSSCRSSAGVYDADLPYSTTVRNDGRLPVPQEFARMFDNVDEPALATELYMPELFRAGADGWRIKEFRIGSAATAQGLQDRLDDSFPWLRDVRWAKVGDADYGKLRHFSRFIGFRAEVTEPREPCAGEFDRSSDRPVIMPQDKQCAHWGKRLGWLAGRPDATMNELKFSMQDLSPVRVATFYRETRLREVAKGHWLRGEQYSWTPRMCFDGFCFQPELSEYGIWPKLQLYYSKLNRVVTVEPSGQEPAIAIQRKSSRPAP